MRQVLNRKKDSQGSAIVEFAMILPILALLLLVTVDLGLLIREGQVLQNAAREGARFSALPSNRMALSTSPSNTKARIQQRVVDYLSQENISVGFGDVSVNQNHAVVVGGFTAVSSRITVSYNRDLVILGGALLPAGSVPLTGSATFRNLY